MLLNFDYDGVIVDSLEQLHSLACQAQASLELGRPPTRYDFATIENLTFLDLGRLIGIPEERISDYAATIFDLQSHDTRSPRLFSGIHTTFRQLAERHILVVVTSSQTDTVFQTLERNGIRDTVSQVLGGDLGLAKAERITRACQEFGVEPGKTLMIGDAVSDIREGKRAGVQTVAVTWGFQDRAFLTQESPDYIVNIPEELLAIVA